MDKLKTMVATSDQNLISEVLIKWNKSSKNEELKEMSDAFCRLFTYINEMELYILTMESATGLMMASKNRAIKSKRKIEKELNDVHKELIEKRKQLKIFTG